VRRWAKRAYRAFQNLDDVHVRRGRHLLRALRCPSPPDVVVFGDSCWVTVGRHEEDRRPLPEVLQAELRPDLVLHAAVGGGYHPVLQQAFVHLVDRSPARPVIVLPMLQRMRTAWRLHPMYRFTEQAAILEQVDATMPVRSVRTVGHRPTAAEFAAFDATPMSTWAGDLTVGEHRNPLRSRGSGLTDAERLRLLYAYHHGEALEPGGEALLQLRELGRRLRDLGAPVVAFQEPVPVDVGEELFGPPFRQRIVDNFTLMDEALTAGFPGLPVLQTGLAFAREEFIDPSDATEHLNASGRLRLARLLADAVRAASAER
jgi:hypothetical protein